LKLFACYAAPKERGSMLKLNEFKGLVIILAITVALAIISPVNSARSAESETLNKIKSSGKVLIGVRNDFPPVGSIDLSGKHVGFGVDLGEVFAKKLGVKPEFVPTTSRTRMPLLLNGSIDLEIGITTPTIERSKTVDFTIPYAWDPIILLVRKGEPKDLKDYGPPKKIATTQGAFSMKVILSQMPNAQFEFFQEYPDAVLAVQNGKVDTVAINGSSSSSFLEKSGGVLEKGNPFFKDPWAILVRPNDSLWLLQVEVMLQETWKEGIYQKLFEKHFGYPPDFYMWSPYMLQPGIE